MPSARFPYGLWVFIHMRLFFLPRLGLSDSIHCRRADGAQWPLWYGACSYGHEDTKSHYISDRLDCCELSLHIQVHILAQCLGIQPLIYLSAYKIVRVLSRASFPTVFPRFVREVYKTFPRRNFLVKRLVVDHAVKVIYQRRARNHFDERFPMFLFGELEEFKLDLAASRTDFPGPLYKYSDSGRIASQLWSCWLGQAN